MATSRILPLLPTTGLEAAPPLTLERDGQLITIGLDEETTDLLNNFVPVAEEVNAVAAAVALDKIAIDQTVAEFEITSAAAVEAVDAGVQTAQVTLTATNVAIADAQALLDEAQEIIMPVKTWFKLKGEVGQTSKPIIAADNTLTDVVLSNQSDTAEFNMGLGGETPVIGEVGIPIGPKETSSQNINIPGTVNLISSADGIKYSGYFANTSGINPNSAAGAEAFLLRYFDIGSMTTPMKNAVKDLYIDFYNADWLDRCSGGFIQIHSQPTLADVKLNWAVETPVTRDLEQTGTPAFTAWRKTTLDGATNGWNSGRLLSQAATQNNNFLAVRTGTSPTVGSGKITVGDALNYLGANRTATAATTHNGSTTHVITVGGAGGLLCMARNDAAGYTVSRNAGTRIYQAEPSTALYTYPVQVGKVRGLGGDSSWWPGDVEAVLCGTYADASDEANLKSMLDAYFTTTAGF